VLRSKIGSEIHDENENSDEIDHFFNGLLTKRSSAPRVRPLHRALAQRPGVAELESLGVRDEGLSEICVVLRLARLFIPRRRVQPHLVCLVIGIFKSRTAAESGSHVDSCLRGSVILGRSFLRAFTRASLLA
jgi:hypothetical protein